MLYKPTDVKLYIKKIKENSQTIKGADKMGK